MPKRTTIWEAPFKNLGVTTKRLSHYTKALQIKPGYAEAHNNLGSALQELGRHDKAIGCYDKGASNQT